MSEESTAENLKHPIGELNKTATGVLFVLDILEAEEYPDGSLLTAQQKNALTDLAIAGSNHALKLSYSL